MEEITSLLWEYGTDWTYNHVHVLVYRSNVYIHVANQESLLPQDP